MDNETLSKIVVMVLGRRFRSRTELATYIGVDVSYISRICRTAVQRGMVDPKAWQDSFRTGRCGHRGPNKKPRVNAHGRTAEKVKQALALKEGGVKANQEGDQSQHAF